MLLFAACTVDDPAPHAGDPEAPPSPDAAPIDGGADPIPWVEEGSVPELEDPAAWIFDPGVVHTLSIELDDDYAALQAFPYTSVMADVVFDGTRVADVGVRLKGKIGSFRDLTGKSSFKIDFGEFVPG